jgi:hypothetical protein
VQVQPGSLLKGLKKKGKENEVDGEESGDDDG